MTEGWEEEGKPAKRRDGQRPSHWGHGTQNDPGPLENAYGDGQGSQGACEKWNGSGARWRQTDEQICCFQRVWMKGPRIFPDGSARDMFVLEGMARAQEERQVWREGETESVRKRRHSWAGEPGPRAQGRVVMSGDLHGPRSPALPTPGHLEGA